MVLHKLPVRSLGLTGRKVAAASCLRGLCVLVVTHWSTSPWPTSRKVTAAQVRTFAGFPASQAWMFAVFPASPVRTFAGFPASVASTRSPFPRPLLQTRASVRARLPGLTCSWKRLLSLYFPGRKSLYPFVLIVHRLCNDP